MSLQHCERCRFNFESELEQPTCPQCGQPAVPADKADRSEDSTKTAELHVIPLPGSK